MSSSSISHLPSDAIPQDAARPVQAPAKQKPVVLQAFAKLVLLVGALAVLTPLWLELLGGAASSEQPDSWIAVRVLVVTGSVGLFALGAIAIKVWTELLKYLARAD
jgi:hypothetical protein